MLSRVVIGLASLVALACRPDQDDDRDDRGDHEGDSDSGGDGDGDGESEAFGAVCELGCAYLFECAPAVFGQRYTNVVECQIGCVLRYAACVPEASVYFACFMDLTCADVALASTEGPGATACGPAFIAAQTACGL
jgi:hypothetical protein